MPAATSIAEAVSRQVGRDQGDLWAKELVHGLRQAVYLNRVVGMAELRDFNIMTLACRYGRSQQIKPEDV